MSDDQHYVDQAETEPSWGKGPAPLWLVILAVHIPVAIGIAAFVVGMVA